MTSDFDRRLQGGGYQDHHHHHQFQPRLSSMATATTASNYGSRLPLQSRHHYSQQPSAMSSSGEGNSGISALNRLSTLESSNNDNNKGRLGSFSGASNHYRGRSQQEQDSSTLAQVNGPAGSSGGGGLGGFAAGQKPTRSESVGRASERGRSQSTQRSSHGAHQQRSTSTSAAARSDGNNSDNENVVIEEKRRRVNGDGYTLHKYLKGRLLGRGGFAKVYLCTALDTNKNYAVKIVPKANLVKQRARQKVITY